MAKITFTQLGAPPAPPSTGQISIYAVGDVLYLIDSYGTIVPIGVASGLTAITGDVTATGPGSAVATVNSVGGASASNIATAVSKVLSAASTSSANTLVLRDGSGNFSAGMITSNLTGVVTGDVNYTPANSGYWVTVPTTVKGALDTVASEINTINTVTSIAYALIFG